MPVQNHWGGSLHSSFQMLTPIASQAATLRAFLGAEGHDKNYVLAHLPYDAARAGGRGTGTPNEKRYRDPRQVFQTAGLLYERADGTMHVTELGNTAREWLDIITPRNCHLLGRHAAYALAVCQLRNPTGAGQGYDPAMEVFPFSFIWEAMLRLDYRISSDELNRAVFRTGNRGDLAVAIEVIREARETDDPSLMGEPTITGDGVNDRIIPWVSIASFGFIMIMDKTESRRAGADTGYYMLRPNCVDILEQATRIRHKHRVYASPAEYVERISRTAALPRDLR